MAAVYSVAYAALHCNLYADTRIQEEPGVRT